MLGRSFVWLLAAGAFGAIFQQIIQKVFDGAFGVEAKSSQFGLWLADPAQGLILAVGSASFFFFIYVADRLRRTLAARNIQHWLAGEHRWSKSALTEGLALLRQEKGTVQVACVDREYAARVAEGYLASSYGHVDYLVVDEFYSSTVDKFIDAIIVRLGLPVSTMRELLASRLLGVQVKDKLRTARFQGLDSAIAQLVEKPHGLILHTDNPDKLKLEAGLANIIELVITRNVSAKPTIVMVSNGCVPFPHIGRVMGLRGLSFNKALSVIQGIYRQTKGKTIFDCNGQIVIDRTGATANGHLVTWGSIEQAALSAKPFPLHAMVKAAELRAEPKDYILSILYWMHLLCDGYPSRLEHLIRELGKRGNFGVRLDELPVLIPAHQSAAASWPAGMFFYNPSFCVPRINLTPLGRSMPVEEIQNILVDLGFLREKANLTALLELNEDFLMRTEAGFEMTKRGRVLLQERANSVQHPKKATVEIETWIANENLPDIGENAVLHGVQGAVFNLFLLEIAVDEAERACISSRFFPSTALQASIAVKRGTPMAQRCVAGWATDMDRVLVEACGLAWPQNEAKSGRRVWLPRPISTDQEKIFRNFELSINLGLEWLARHYEAINWRGAPEAIADAIADGSLLEFPGGIYQAVGSLSQSSVHRDATVTYAKQLGVQSFNCSYYLGCMLGMLVHRRLVSDVMYEHARFDWPLARLAGIMAGDLVDDKVYDPTGQLLFPRKTSIPTSADECGLFKYLLLHLLYFGPQANSRKKRPLLNWEEAAALELANMTGEDEFNALLQSIVEKKGLHQTVQLHLYILARHLHFIHDHGVLHVMKEIAGNIPAIPKAEQDEEHPLRLAITCWIALDEDADTARIALKKFKSAGDISFLRAFEFKQQFIDDVEERLQK